MMLKKGTVQASLRRSLSGLKENPSLAQQIIAKSKVQVQSKRKANKKIYAAIIITGIMILTMAAGIAIKGEPWGLIDWILDAQPEKHNTISQESIDQTVFPSSGTIISYQEKKESNGSNTLSQQRSGSVELGIGTISVREIVSDGYGVYISVSAKPSSLDVLLLNFDINPFEDSPAVIGQIEEFQNQTIAEWAVGHGYKELIRVSLSSPAPDPYTHGRLVSSLMFDPQSNSEHITQIDTYEIERVAFGSNFDSFRNAKMLLEEDGTSLIMVSGGYTGLDRYDVACTLVPWRMTADGQKDPSPRDIPSRDVDDELLDFEYAEHERITLKIPTLAKTDCSVLAEYEGVIPEVNNSSRTVPIRVQFIRTPINDYCIVRSEDLERIYEAVSVYLNIEQTKGLDYSNLFVSSYRSDEGEIVFTQSCISPSVFPSQLYLRWDDYESNLSETVVVTETGNR